MPLYDYRCGRCHHVFELRQSFSDDPTASCPRCQGEASRLFRPVPIIFKGSGWYVNDYGGKKALDSPNETGNGSDGHHDSASPSSADKPAKQESPVPSASSPPSTQGK